MLEQNRNMLIRSTEALHDLFWWWQLPVSLYDWNQTRAKIQSFIISPLGPDQNKQTAGVKAASETAGTDSMSCFKGGDLWIVHNTAFEQIQWTIRTVVDDSTEANIVADLQLSITQNRIPQNVLTPNSLHHHSESWSAGACRRDVNSSPPTTNFSISPRTIRVQAQETEK